MSGKPISLRAVERGFAKFRTLKLVQSKRHKDPDAKGGWVAINFPKWLEIVGGWVATPPSVSDSSPPPMADNTKPLDTKPKEIVASRSAQRRYSVPDKEVKSTTTEANSPDQTIPSNPERVETPRGKAQVMRELVDQAEAVWIEEMQSYYPEAPLPAWTGKDRKIVASFLTTKSGNDEVMLPVLRSAIQYWEEFRKTKFSWMGRVSFKQFMKGSNRKKELEEIERLKKGNDREQARAAMISDALEQEVLDNGEPRTYCEPCPAIPTLGIVVRFKAIFCEAHYSRGRKPKQKATDAENRHLKEELNRANRMTEVWKGRCHTEREEQRLKIVKQFEDSGVLEIIAEEERRAQAERITISPESASWWQEEEKRRDEEWQARNNAESCDDEFADWSPVPEFSNPFEEPFDKADVELAA
jgi:hypothetical protein